MSAKSSILQQGDGLGTLKELMEAMRDPKQITLAHETYRKEIALTEDEQTKVEKAREFILDYEQKLQSLNKANEDLTTAKVLHQDNVDKFKEDYTLRTNELKDLSNSLDEKSGMLDNKDSLHNKDKANFYAEKSAQEEQLHAILKLVQDREEAATKKEAFNINESLRLTELESQLKIKAAKVRASIEEI